MIESHSETAPGIWSPPESPFTVEYSPHVLDEIRLAVLDAFFSLPRGGAEIGGILLGKREGERVVISDYRPLDCEHAYGPSFTLSARDLQKMAELLASASAHPQRLEPIGWYHSHTRSDIFLSEADREIHDRFFPQPGQVALVLRPHTLRQMRAGFFVRESDGSMRDSGSYHEFALAPLSGAPPDSMDSARSASDRKQNEPAVPARGPVAHARSQSEAQSASSQGEAQLATREPVAAPSQGEARPPAREPAASAVSEGEAQLSTREPVAARSETQLPARESAESARPQSEPQPPTPEPATYTSQPDAAQNGAAMHTEPESAALAETAEFPIQDLSAAPATEAGAANGSGDRAARPNDPAKAEPKTNGATAGRTGFPPPVRRPMAERSGHSEPVADKAAAAPVTDLPLPAFAAAPPKRSRKPLWGLLAVGVGLALGAAGYEARVKLWLQAGAPAKASPDPKSAQPAVSLGLNTIDLDGQLQIRWDQNSPAILSAASGALEITDGGPVQALQLDQEQLRAGIQTYARRGEKVGVTLIVNRAEGSLRETTGFFGKLPEPQPPEPTASDRQRLVSQRDELMRLNARLRADLAKQTERALRAELAAEEMRRLLRAEQRRRPENAAPAAIK